MAKHKEYSGDIAFSRGVDGVDEALRVLFPFWDDEVYLVNITAFPLELCVGRIKNIVLLKKVNDLIQKDHALLLGRWDEHIACGHHRLQQQVLFYRI